VIIQENTERAGERVRLLERPSPGENLRRRGEDLKLGALALAAGTRLGPFQLGLAAALDRARVVVSRRPRLVVLPTGDELRAPGSPGSSDAIPESNSVALAALATLAGADAGVGARLTDDVEITSAAITHALDRADVVVTVGGMSVGDHDRVRPALERAGVSLDFWKVRMQPGKPFAFGRRDGAFVLGLPGNPVSAQVSFFLFGVPLLRALQGDRSPLPPTSTVELAQALSRKPGRLGVYRARLQGTLAILDDNQSSGATTSLAAADALVFVPAESSECPAGTPLPAVRLDIG
jgi:molybdopterin molybdotransferase